MTSDKTHMVKRVAGLSDDNNNHGFLDHARDDRATQESECGGTMRIVEALGAGHPQYVHDAPLQTQIPKVTNACALFATTWRHRLVKGDPHP